MSKCEFKYCKSDLEGTVRVGENIGDACFSTRICTECADCVGLKEGQDIPDDATAVNRKLIKHYRVTAGNEPWDLSQPSALQDVDTITTDNTGHLEAS